MQEERFIRSHKGVACHSINRRGDMGYRSELVSVGIKEAKWISVISHIDTHLFYSWKSPQALPSEHVPHFLQHCNQVLVYASHKKSEECLRDGIVSRDRSPGNKKGKNDKRQNMKNYDKMKNKSYNEGEMRAFATDWHTDKHAFCMCAVSSEAGLVLRTLAFPIPPSVMRRRRRGCIADGPPKRQGLSPSQWNPHDWPLSGAL